MDAQIRAAMELVAALGEMENAGRNIVTTLLDGAPFVALEHYPPDDVRDPETNAQYYFHAHRGRLESGHIHCFLRDAENTLTHVAAIGLDQTGRPTRMFTTNLWATADVFTPAGTLIEQLPRMNWPAAPGPAPVNRALSALFVLYRREIAALLRRRDARLARYAATIAPADPLQDERLEVLSTARINLPVTLARLRARLALTDE
ncbi:MAG: hypothetical protein KGQ79_03390 [Proteobacteria bacterium]|nr:hypothetical protein [Pseudomonadota bacterium]MDE2390977.1 hypothetical protein [Rhodospirillales bacterium]